jgi:hypothetical protein
MTRTLGPAPLGFIPWILGLLLAALLPWHLASGTPCWRGWVVSVVEVLDPTTVELDVSWEPRHVATERIQFLSVPLRGAWSEPLATTFIATWLAHAGPTEVIVCRPNRDAAGRLVGRIVSAERGDLAAAVLLADQVGAPGTPAP